MENVDYLFGAQDLLLYNNVETGIDLWMAILVSQERSCSGRLQMLLSHVKYETEFLSGLYC